MQWARRLPIVHFVRNYSHNGYDSPVRWRPNHCVSRGSRQSICPSTRHFECELSDHPNARTHSCVWLIVAVFGHLLVRLHGIWDDNSAGSDEAFYFWYKDGTTSVTHLRVKTELRAHKFRTWLLILSACVALCSICDGWGNIHQPQPWRPVHRSGVQVFHGSLSPIHDTYIHTGMYLPAQKVQTNEYNNIMISGNRNTFLEWQRGCMFSTYTIHSALKVTKTEYRVEDKSRGQNRRRPVHIFLALCRTTNTSNCSLKAILPNQMTLFCIYPQ